MNETTYTQGHSEAVLRSHTSRTAETSAAFLLPHLKRDARILDVGCGPGTITTSFARYIPEGSIVGTDFSSDVIAEARKRLAESSSSEEAQRCSFEVASVHDLPYPSETFDVVYCHQMLLHLPEPVKALQEMRRVCKPGGIVAAREADFSSVIVHPPQPTTRLWVETAEAVYRSIGAEPDAGRRLVSWALEAGFEAGERITFSSSNMAYGGQPGVRFWGQMWAERVAAEEWKKQALNTGKVSMEEVEQMERDWLRWSETQDGVFVMLCGEVLMRK